MALHNVCSRWFAPGTLLWLLLIAAARLVLAAAPDEPAGVILHVAKDGTAEHVLIQAAIDAAPTGATIRVGPGTYEEHVKVDKPIVVEGAGWNQTTIAGPWNKDRSLVERAVRDLEQRLRAAQTDQERSALTEDFRAQYAPAPLEVGGTRGVQIRGVKITTSAAAPGESFLAGSLVIVCRATVVMTDCAILGSPRGGLRIVDGADVEIRRSLIAAVWETGITIGQRGGGAGSHVIVAECDVRNCHYAGIGIVGPNDATIERCRISGAAWHGVRYDDTSPKITGNLIFAHARCGIYASGSTAAAVTRNVFRQNEMNGMSCLFANRDTIAENTFADNRREALTVIGGSAPRVERNVFVGHPKAIVCRHVSGEPAAAGAVASPVLRKNLFWQNNVNLFRADPTAQEPEAGKEVPLDAETASMMLDPGLIKSEAGDVSFAEDSPARRAGIGASDHVELASPWPLQPEELAIIPDGSSRDSRLWKKPGAEPQQSEPAAVGGPARSTGPPPPVVFLYHRDADVRMHTIDALAASRDPTLIDDLIRAHAVEYSTPVHNAYFRALRPLTGQAAPRGPGAWKAWLSEEAAAGRLKIDYLPLSIDALSPDDRTKLQPLVAQLGPEHLDRMVQDLTGKGRDTAARTEALRYLLANDHCEDVQQVLAGDWLAELLALDELEPPMINVLAYYLNALADPGPVRERVNAQVRQCLKSENPIVLAHALHLLAGVEGFSTVFVVPDAAPLVRTLLEHPSTTVADQARRAIQRVDPQWVASQVTLDAAFVDLYEVLGREYPCFALKGIDWAAVGQELLPRAKTVKTQDEFGLLCLELVARLEDSHAQLGPGTVRPPTISLPRFDPGFTCLIDDRGRPVVYYVDRDSPADRAGVRVGMTVLAIDGKPAEEVLGERMKQLSRYIGYSSDRYLRYHAAQFLPRQMERGTTVTLELEDVEGKSHQFALPAVMDVRYLPRLPVPIPGIRDAGSVSWTMLPTEGGSQLPSNIGYIYVRRIQGDLLEKLDQAVGELKDARGLVIDVRGNSGGGFDAQRAHRNFALNDTAEPDRPRFAGPIALLIDARCISAGEGWASWFVATKRACLFGEATAGASSRKRNYTLKNGLYTVTIPVKAYTGFLGQPIERRGLEPDVAVRPNAHDLAAGRDTVLEAARQYLLAPQ